MIVDSTNTSSRFPLGYIQVENGEDATSFPLYAASILPSSIVLADEGTVKENWKYSLRLILPAEIEISNVVVSVNGGDVLNAGYAECNVSEIKEQRYLIYELEPTSDGRYPFLLTFGFARLEVRVEPANGQIDEMTLSTCDIPCESNAAEQVSLIQSMLNELLDMEDEDVAQWMFTGERNECLPENAMNVKHIQYLMLHLPIMHPNL